MEVAEKVHMFSALPPKGRTSRNAVAMSVWCQMRKWMHLLAIIGGIANVNRSERGNVPRLPYSVIGSYPRIKLAGQSSCVLFPPFQCGASTLSEMHRPNF